MEFLLTILLLCGAPFVSGALMYAAFVMLSNVIGFIPELTYFQCCLIMLAISLLFNNAESEKMEVGELYLKYFTKVIGRGVLLLIMFLFYVIFF